MRYPPKRTETPNGWPLFSSRPDTDVVRISTTSSPSALLSAFWSSDTTSRSTAVSMALPATAVPKPPSPVICACTSMRPSVMSDSSSASVRSREPAVNGPSPAVSMRASLDSVGWMSKETGLPGSFDGCTSPLNASVTWKRELSVGAVKRTLALPPSTRALSKVVCATTSRLG